MSRYLRIITTGLAAFGGAGLLALMLRNIVPAPQYLDLGILQIHLYSLCLLTAFAVCIYLVSRLVQTDGKLSRVDVWEGILYVFVPAIIFARVYHVITDFQLYGGNLLNMFAIWNGGLGLIGGLAGGALGLYFYTRGRQIAFNRIIGVVAVTVPLGQAIGRLGNFFNHELYGSPTGLPWGEFIPPAFRKPGLAQFEFFQPLFLYEALANLIVFAGLYYLWRRGWRGYILAAVYLGAYSVIRFCLDFLRLDGNTGFGGLSYTQWLILAGWLITAIVLICRKYVIIPHK